MAAPDLDELSTLVPPDDLPDDALCQVTAADLRALTALISCAREVESVFGSYLPEEAARD